MGIVEHSTVEVSGSCGGLDEPSATHPLLSFPGVICCGASSASTWTACQDAAAGSSTGPVAVPGVLSCHLTIVTTPGGCSADSPALDLAHHFARLPDPRHPGYRDHHLLGDIVVIALGAVLCGVTSWTGMVRWAKARILWLRSLGLLLPNGIPSHDTFRWVFSNLDPVAFQDCFTDWINAWWQALGVRHIPIDGKVVRGTRGANKTCLCLVSAFASEHRLSLAQVAVPGKSNEIKAIPLVLRVLELAGALVSIDAIGCQKDIAKQIRTQKGHYLLAVKANQPGLLADIEAVFEAAYRADFEGYECDVFACESKGHGRTEERVVTVLSGDKALSGVSQKDQWQDLAAVVRVARTRRSGSKESFEVSYYITSGKGNAEELAQGIRGHWGIENGCHWVLDVIFKEDACRTRTGHAAENLAWIRKIALALLRRDDSLKDTTPNKMIEAAGNNAYLLRILGLLLPEHPTP